MSISFEKSRSYVYRAARYELLPKIAEMARQYNDQPFLLRDLTRQVLDETYSREQLETRLKRAKSEATDSIRTIFGFYMPFLAEKLRVFENLGGGRFRNYSLEEEEEELAEADDVASDIESDDSGTIYAYSFPTLMKENANFPIKVGLTKTGDAEARVSLQCKQTCCFEFPKLIHTWEVSRVAAVENAIHSILEARGSKRNAPGTEWFDTTLAELEEIMQFIHKINNCR